MGKVEYQAPGIHGPSLTWTSIPGALAWCVRSSWRFWVTGKPVWGRGDNASFLHDATEDYRHRPVEKLTRARWRRVAWRWGVAGVPLLLWALLGRWWAAGYLACALAAGGAAAWRWWAAWWPHREERREMVYPAWQVACKILGEKFSKRVAARSVVLADLSEEQEYSARVHLPAVPLDDGMKKRLVASVGERLGIKDPAASWVVRGARAYVDLAPRVYPPRALTFAEVRKLWLDADPARPFVGLAAGRAPVYADLDNDGPHVGLSGGTGSGKSTLLRVLLAKRMASGAGMVFCDYKVTSHPWARRIAQQDPHRALYLMDEQEIHEGIMAVWAEFVRRRETLKTDPSALDTFRPVDLVVEEVNSLAIMLGKWWRLERKRLVQEAKDMDVPAEDTPVVCPSVDALSTLVQMGRELKLRVHFAAQRLDASALSPRNGGAVRESITNRFLAKYTKKAWDMLCGGVPYQAFPGGPRGVWAAVIGDVVTFFRVPFMSNDEAVDLVLAGVTPEGPVLGGRVSRRQVEAPVSIQEALDRLGPRAPSIDAARKRVQRAELVPAGKRGTADLFDWAELERVLQAS
jgi:uncharacterized protein DUF87